MSMHGRPVMGLISTVKNKLIINTHSILLVSTFFINSMIDHEPLGHFVTKRTGLHFEDIRLLAKLDNEFLSSLANNVFSL